MKKLFFISVLIYSSVFCQSFWQSAKGPEGGEIYALAYNSQGHIFAGTCYGGMFRSTDNGNNWQSINNGLPRSSWILSIGIANNDDIYIGLYNNGLYYSMDNGDSWTKIQNGLPDDASVSAIAFGNGSSSYIYTGTDIGLYIRPHPDSNWTNKLNANITGIAIHPDGDIFVIQHQSGIKRSSNQGDSWTLCNNGFPYNFDIYSIAISRYSSTNGYIYIGTYANGIYRTTNKGDNWEKKSNGLPSDNGMGFHEIVTNNQNGNIYAAAFSISVAANNGAYLSTDGGENWIKDNDGLPGNPPLRAMAISSIGNLVLGINSDDMKGGVYKSEDNGNSWSEINNNLSATNIMCVSSFGDTLLAGSYFGAIFKSGDWGDTWLQIGQNLAKPRSIVVNSKGYIFVGSNYRSPWNGGVFRTTDNGNYWERLSGGLPIGLETFQILLKQNGGNQDLYIAAYGGVYISTNDGTTWTSISNGLPGSTYNYCIESSKKTNTMFVGNSYGLYRTTDYGGNWTQVTNGLPSTTHSVYCLGTTNFDASTEYIYAGVFKFSNSKFYIYRSSDDGLNWQKLSGYDSNYAATSLQTNNSNKIFVGTQTNGFYYSEDYGVTWNEINDGCDNKFINQLNQNSDGYLLSATYGSGVFRSSNSITSINSDSKNIPSQFLLSQNYPNPFNPSTVINYQLPVGGPVKLTIYNILGQEVATLVNEFKEAGQYKVSWDASNLTSGVYIYTLQSGDNMSVKKMVLLK